MIEGQAAKQLKADPRLLLAVPTVTAKRCPADMVIAREFDRRQQLEPPAPPVVAACDRQPGSPARCLLAKWADECAALWPCFGRPVSLLGCGTRAQPIRGMTREPGLCQMAPG